MREGSDAVYPEGFRRLVLEELDFEGAFRALANYTHFYSEALRGFLRRLQNRTRESWHHLNRAEALFKKTPSPQRDAHYYFLLRFYATGTALVEEARRQSRDATARTDEAMLRFSRLQEPVTELHDRMRITQLAYYQIIRGEYTTALESFVTLIGNDCSALEPQRVGMYCGAAAAAMELGEASLAEQHYSNAVLGIGLLEQPFQLAIYASRLYVLLEYWGRPEEARQWLDQLETLPGPPETRRCFVERAALLAATSSRRQRIFLA